MIQAIQLILSLSFLVLIHELGHFTFARIFKVRVEKFYMFFNPWMSLVRMKKFNGKWHVKFFAKNEDEEWDQHPDNTEWGIGWLPFGGYCAIGGMVDETHTTEDLGKEVQPWEFRSKPAWQRMLIILGGIMVNFLGALVIYWMLLWQYGKDTMPISVYQNGFYYPEYFVEEGFQQQDKILTINGEEPREMGDILWKIIIDDKRDVQVLRGTDTVNITISDDFINHYFTINKDAAPENLLTPWIPSVLDTVHADFPAMRAGLQAGDRIVSVGGVLTPSYPQMVQQLKKHPCDSVTIAYYRGEVLDSVRVFLNDECKLGVQARMDFQPVHTSYSFFRALPAGVKFGSNVLAKYVRQFRVIFTNANAAQSVGGFGTIGSMFPSQWSWQAFWSMTAFLSIILAFMNFLPIPALDGGYVLFLLWEMITRRKPSDRFLEIANKIGFWLLLAILILANLNDIKRFFF